jgi:thiamine pyrophosphate-dependent acetolactate synthase large subunit-like protein
VVLDEKVAYDSVQFVYQKGIAYGYQMRLGHLVWIDGFYDMVGIQQMAKYGRLSGVTLAPVDVVRFAEALAPED